MDAALQKRRREEHSAAVRSSTGASTESERCCGCGLCGPVAVGCAGLWLWAERAAGRPLFAGGPAWPCARHALRATSCNGHLIAAIRRAATQYGQAQPQPQGPGCLLTVRPPTLFQPPQGSTLSSPTAAAIRTAASAAAAAAMGSLGRAGAAEARASASSTADYGAAMVRVRKGAKGRGTNAAAVGSDLGAAGRRGRGREARLRWAPARPVRGRGPA
jgi:hypothetical protein